MSFPNHPYMILPQTHDRVLVETGIMMGNQDENGIRDEWFACVNLKLKDSSPVFLEKISFKNHFFNSNYSSGQFKIKYNNVTHEVKLPFAQLNLSELKTELSTILNQVSATADALIDLSIDPDTQILYLTTKYDFEFLPFDQNEGSRSVDLLGLLNSQKFPANQATPFHRAFQKYPARVCVSCDKLSSSFQLIPYAPQRNGVPIHKKIAIIDSFLIENTAVNFEYSHTYDFPLTLTPSPNCFEFNLDSALLFRFFNPLNSLPLPANPIALTLWIKKDSYEN